MSYDIDKTIKSAGRNNQIVHTELQHDYRFCDIVDCGSEIQRIYLCGCGARMIEVYLLLETRWIESGDRHDNPKADDQS